MWLQYLRARRWSTLLGYLLFIGMMAVGYYYNVTFVQLGLLDLGTRLVGMSEGAVAGRMALLALLACLVALGTGFTLQRLPRLRQLRRRLQLAFIVVLAQALLTAIAPAIRSQAAYTAWIVLASLALGIGMPVTFSLTLDLIPVRDRGLVAALITGGAYTVAAAIPSSWQIDAFRTQLLLPLAAGTVGLGLLAFLRPPFVAVWESQHEDPAFAIGRFVRFDARGRPRVGRRFLALLVLMFGIYFVDSLGFLRVIETPALVNSAWRSPDLSPHLIIAGAHAVAALIAGVLYSALDEKHLFLWIFGLFALVHYMYTFPFQLAPGGGEPLATPVLYAIAVSLYTVVNFAIWADISTPQTISRNAAVGVALSGWTATFVSTALATHWQTSGMSVMHHLRLVNAVATIFFLALVLWPFLPLPARFTTTEQNAPEAET